MARNTPRLRITWPRLCACDGKNGSDAVQCPHRIEAIRASAGLTAHAQCGLSLLTPCDWRKNLRIVVARELKRPWGRGNPLAQLPVVAHFDLERLVPLSRRRLYDVLPVVRGREIAALWTFARDYAGRGVPWAVTLFGDNLTLWKTRRA